MLVLSVMIASNSISYITGTIKSGSSGLYDEGYWKSRRV